MPLSEITIHNSILCELLSALGYPTSASRDKLLAYTIQAFSRIPYENISKIYSFHTLGLTSAKHTPQELISQFLSHGTGGTCFPLSIALSRFISSLGFEAYPILADRRYGRDTHSAVIFREDNSAWALLDPGYLINSPCPLPSAGTVTQYKLAINTIELRSSFDSTRVELYTVDPQFKLAEPRYRLTYKIIPVDEDAFNAAWDRSFSFEMMSYPVISVARGEKHIYIQKDTVTIRDSASRNRIVLPADQFIIESSRLTGIRPEILSGVIRKLNK